QPFISRFAVTCPQYAPIGDMGNGTLFIEVAYKWLGDLIVCIGTERLYGEIFDFRDVRSFSTDNLIDARKKSRKMNIMMNTQDFPVAMVVANDMQEQILRGPMRIMEENPRKRIVHATEDALAFLDEWHNRSARA
ncbi:MAG: hypothetical protein AAF787_09665, partial [Chloroflexota bacterium]